ncbi:hypothetical protein ACTFIV_008824 [Dictyostelium citrinum]
MDFLKLWLCFIALIRFLIMFFLIFNPNFILKRGYPIALQKKQATKIFCRSLFFWATGNLMIAIITILNMDNKQLLLVSWFTFIIALCHYITEAFFFKSCTVKDILFQSGLCGVSAIWFGLRLLSL